MAEPEDLSLVALARALAKAGRTDEAAAVVGRLLAQEFGLAATNFKINADIYSLNSLNGTFDAGGAPLFFKFHQEENEGAMSGEYYRARLLADAGLPVDLPIHASATPGRQILVYRRCTDARLADVVRALDANPDAAMQKDALAAESALNQRTMEVYRRTLHPITPVQSAAEPIHRLFHERLLTPGAPGNQGGRLGGRFASFYEDKLFDLPGLKLPWSELSRLTPAINGIRYERTIGELFDEAFARMAPDLLGGGGVTAHGDAHNANVWFTGEPGARELVLFDPAFAGSDVPALLAEIKTTFHNVFAHPFWLYEPAEAAKHYKAAATRTPATLHIVHNCALSPVRREILELKARDIWKPLLALLKERELLPLDWRRVVRLGLFLCPTLVMNLRAGAEGGSHSPVSSAIGLATAITMGAEPVTPDLLSGLLDSITPA